MKHCLVVDDSRVVRRVSRHMLESLEFSVSEAEDGRRALALCAEAMPDLILLDWNMPVMNGMEFLTELRKSEPGAGPKVVFCTTEYDADCIRGGFAGGADEYVIKPFDQQTLEQKLHWIGII